MAFNYSLRFSKNEKGDLVRAISKKVNSTVAKLIYLNHQQTAFWPDNTWLWWCQQDTDHPDFIAMLPLSLLLISTIPTQKVNSPVLGCVRDLKNHIHYFSQSIDTPCENCSKLTLVRVLSLFNVIQLMWIHCLCELLLCLSKMNWTWKDFLCFYYHIFEEDSKFIYWFQRLAGTFIEICQNVSMDAGYQLFICLSYMTES